MRSMAFADLWPWPLVVVIVSLGLTIAANQGELQITQGACEHANQALNCCDALILVPGHSQPLLGQASELAPLGISDCQQIQSLTSLICF